MSHTHHTPHTLPEILKEHGFRVTRGKLGLLSLLKQVGHPLSIQQIAASWEGKAPDTATLYRALSDLSNAGIIRRIDLNTGVAHFEYSPDRPHHHHIVCSNCGTIEEIEGCSIDSLQKKISTTSKRFTQITTHNLEFFGQCTTCLPTR